MKNVIKSLLILASIIPVSCTTSSSNPSLSTVTIGSQVWANKNLDLNHYSNGDEIPQVQNGTTWANLTTGAWCYYENITSNGPVFGKLYNWYAIHDPRGLAPAGYHIPSDDEWTTLITFLGGEAVAGGKMKTTTGWNNPFGDATNSSGFTGLPAGHRDDHGAFYYIGDETNWWSSSEADLTGAWSHGLSHYDAHAYRTYVFKQEGLSVRCIKD